MTDTELLLIATELSEAESHLFQTLGERPLADIYEDFMSDEALKSLDFLIDNVLVALSRRSYTTTPAGQRLYELLVKN